MKRKPHKTRPGEFELRIRPDGRICVLAADDALMEVVQSLDELDPGQTAQRKGRTRAQSRKARRGG